MDADLVILSSPNNPSNLSSPRPTIHTLPFPFNSPTSPAEKTLISQGAEALLYKTTFLPPSSPHTSILAALKYRPPKPYRHPTLDRRLTKARVLAEARVLARCHRLAMPVPRLLGLGCAEGWIMMEWIDGRSIKDVLRSDHVDMETKRMVLRDIGATIGKLHCVAGVVHGDLTTSNLLFKTRSKKEEIRGEEEEEEEEEGGEVVLIDFGLAQYTVQDEDRAVDLYVLERAFGSTHPELEGLFDEQVLASYSSSFKGAKIVLKRLEDVRLRGRKKSMIG